MQILREADAEGMFATCRKHRMTPKIISGEYWNDKMPITLVTVAQLLNRL